MKIKKVELSGIIEFVYDDWNKIKLVQEDGYKFDLVSRFQEAIENFGKKGVQVNYWVADKPCKKNELIEGWLKKLFGDIEAEYTAEDYAYSSWTTGTDYFHTLSIGGHSLYNELSDKEGKFVFIELNFQL